MWGIGLKRFWAEGFRVWGEEFECATLFAVCLKWKIQGLKVYSLVSLQECISCLLRFVFLWWSCSIAAAVMLFSCLVIWFAWLERETSRVQGILAIFLWKISESWKHEILNLKHENVNYLTYAYVLAWALPLGLKRSIVFKNCLFAFRMFPFAVVWFWERQEMFWDSGEVVGSNDISPIHCVFIWRWDVWASTPWIAAHNSC